MGANASTAVPFYTSGEVLDAARLNLTNAGIPVFGGTATRDAAFGGTGEKTLAEGQFAYLEDTNATQYYDGSTWQAVASASGLTLVKTQTIGTAVNTVTVTNAFSATYDNYMITLSGGVGSTTFNGLLQLGATTTNYYSFVVYGTYAATTVSGQNTSNGSSFGAWFTGTTNTIDGYLIIKNPFLTKRTIFTAFGATAATTDAVFWAQGFLDNATSYTDIKFLVNGAATMTGGEIRIYGMANS